MLALAFMGTAGNEHPGGTFVLTVEVPNRWSIDMTVVTEDVTEDISRPSCFASFLASFRLTPGGQAERCGRPDW